MYTRTRPQLDAWQVWVLENTQKYLADVTSLSPPFFFQAMQIGCIMARIYRVPHHVLKRGFARQPSHVSVEKLTAELFCMRQVGDAFLSRLSGRDSHFAGAG